MFPIAFEVTFTGDGFDNKRALKGHMRLMLQAILFAWLQNFFDFHFERSAYTRYPGVYEQRGRSDFQSPPKDVLDKNPRARPIAVRTRPNWSSGRMKRALKASARITGTSKVATLRMMGPFYTDLVNTPNQPDKAHEITYINPAEAKALRRLGRDFLVRSINANRSVRRVRIGAV